MAFDLVGLTPIERLMAQIKIDGECWNWTGYVNPKGYGSFRLGRKRFYSSKAAYILFRGEVPSGLFVCHKCDNPRCCNPDHLFLGTNAENVKDMVTKKRHRFGSRKPNSKLKEVYVNEIFRITRLRYFEHEELAKMYGVCRPLITDLLNKRRWKHCQTAR